MTEDNQGKTPPNSEQKTDTNQVNKPNTDMQIEQAKRDKKAKAAASKNVAEAKKLTAKEARDTAQTTVGINQDLVADKSVSSTLAHREIKPNLPSDQIPQTKSDESQITNQKSEEAETNTGTRQIASAEHSNDALKEPQVAPESKLIKEAGSTETTRIGNTEPFKAGNTATEDISQIQVAQANTNQKNYQQPDQDTTTPNSASYAHVTQPTPLNPGAQTPGTHGQPPITVTHEKSLTVDGPQQTQQVKEDGATDSVQGKLIAHGDTSQTVIWSSAKSQGQFGSLQINAATGQWQYHLDNTSVNTNSLSEGEKHTEQFVITATDNEGNHVDSLVIINVEGTNDLPTVSGSHHGSLTEQGTVDSVVGQLVATDVDHNDNANWSILNGQGNFGQLTINPNTGQWQYHLDNQSANTRALNQGDKATEQFIVNVTDSSGQSVSQQVTIDIQGKNNLARISGSYAGLLSEDKDVHDGQLRVDGVLSVTDVDNGQAQFTAESLQGQFGTLSINDLGHWTYTADNAQAAIQGLKTGESLTDTLLVHSVDGTEQKITVTINGTDDKAVIGGTSTANLTEDKDVHQGGLRADGNLSITDPDNGQAQFTAESLKGQFGTLSINDLGHWIYTADNSQTVIQGLKTGESLTDTLLVHSVDGTEQKITVTINGAGDKAVIGGTSTANLTEDKDVHQVGLRADGNLSITDPDNGQAQFTAESLQGQFGTLSINDLGHWIYTADNSQAVIQGLKTSESLTDTLLVHSVDGTEQKITVTINGT
ncbi:VCBS domain-containing protein, partial [Shewanella maritima]|uniref:VCBS domain-containing protein n=1 Tax=Shewanella maritima TaxID=2520507 RepID=UPI003736C53C